MDPINAAISFLVSIMNLPNEFLKFLNFTDPPVSSLFIFCVSVGVTIFSVSVSRRFIDTDKLKRYNMELKRHNALKMKALKGTDSKAIKKYELEKDEMSKIQKDMMSMRMKPMMFTFIPVIIVFGLMNGFYGPGNPNGAVPAVLPFPFLESLIIIPLGENISDAAGRFQYFQMSYIGWYFTVSISVGAVIQKIAGLTP